MIKDQFIIIVILHIIAATKVFDLVQIATQGGPGASTHVLGTYLYMVAFRFLRVGYASVIAVITFVVSLIFGAIYINYDRLTKMRARRN
jgi:ABC-type sugar transport system permease subunit